MIRDQKIPDSGLKEMVLYHNIRRSSITKVSMCPDFFSCSKFIGWILPKTQPSSRIIYDVKGEPFASFHPSHIETDYKLPLIYFMMIEYWIKGINIDPLEYAMKMVVPKK